MKDRRVASQRSINFDLFKIVLMYSIVVEERCCLHKYHRDGLSCREIARLMDRDVSTVSRELRRNSYCKGGMPTCSPYIAQGKYRRRRFYCHRGDVPLAGDYRLHQREAAPDLVAGTDFLHALRAAHAELADDLPMDL